MSFFLPGFGYLALAPGRDVFIPGFGYFNGLPAYAHAHGARG